MTKWLTVKDASEYLGVSDRTIQRYIKDGKVKAKTISGKTTVADNTLEAVKTGTEATPTRQVNDKRHDTTTPDESQVSQNWTPPEGYVLVDKDTLDTIKNQLNALTTELKEMRTTQQLLIEKGLNLRQLSDNTSQGDTTQPQQYSDTVAEVVAETELADNDSDTTATPNDSNNDVADVATDKKPEPNPLFIYVTIALIVIFGLFYWLSVKGYISPVWLERLGLYPHN